MTPYVATIDGTEYTVTPKPTLGRLFRAHVEWVDGLGQQDLAFSDSYMAGLFCDYESNFGRAARAYFQWFNAKVSAS